MKLAFNKETSLSTCQPLVCIVDLFLLTLVVGGATVSRKKIHEHCKRGHIGVLCLGRTPMSYCGEWTLAWWKRETHGKIQLTATVDIADVDTCRCLPVPACTIRRMSWAYFQYVHKAYMHARGIEKSRAFSASDVQKCPLFIFCDFSCSASEIISEAEQSRSFQMGFPCLLPDMHIVG